MKPKDTTMSGELDEGILRHTCADGALPVLTADSAPSGRKVAALFVETNGCYFGQPGVDPWDEARDAKRYPGPHPVVAHPPCQRWGRYSENHPIVGRIGTTGDDGGCFEAALKAVRRWGGVLEHPADSKAWTHFQIRRPTRYVGWQRADQYGGWTCYVEQGHYGHAARKATWLYACLTDHPPLIWSKGEQALPQWMIDRYGYARARRIGVVAMIGGKDKVKKRNATPEAFRDVLLSIAQSVHAIRESAETGYAA